MRNFNISFLHYMRHLIMLVECRQQSPCLDFMRHVIMFVRYCKQSPCFDLMLHLTMLFNCQYPMTSFACAAGLGMKNAQQTEPLDNLAVDSLLDFILHLIMPVLSSTGLDECVWISVVAARGSLTLPECFSQQHLSAAAFSRNKTLRSQKPKESEPTLLDVTPFHEMYYSSRAILPLIGCLTFIVTVVLRKVLRMCLGGCTNVYHSAILLSSIFFVA